MWKLQKHKNQEIAPDEIFLDSSNISEFDGTQLEGRLEKPLQPYMYRYFTALFLVLFIILITRTWNLQVTHSERFTSLSKNNSLYTKILLAPRGAITDINGTILAENTEEDGLLKRIYNVPSIGHIIGYISYPKKDAKGIYYDTVEKGITGLEAKYNSLLAGKNGSILVEKDVTGKVSSEGMFIAAESGKTLRLSIDAHLSELLAQAIARIVKSEGFVAGSGVIMSTETGAIRAIVSYPSYDPNVILNDNSSDMINAYYNDPGLPFLNRAVSGVYAPGSIVKPLVAAGALTDGIITPTTVIDDPGSISILDPYKPGKIYVFKSWKKLGAMDVRKALAWSSSVFFYEVGGGFKSQKGMGINRLEYWYRQFGLGDKTGVDISSESAGRIPTPAWKKENSKEDWYLSDTYFTAIGQYAMQVTPIQMARATAAVANDGTLFTPTLLADALPSSIKILADSSALTVVREGMRLAVTDGTAGPLNLPYVRVAAKTGTAQTGTRNQYMNSWVSGFFPYENPKYAFVVVLEKGIDVPSLRAGHAMRNLFESLKSENSDYLK